MSDIQNASLRDAVNAASRRWQNAFNSKDAKGCAGLYEENAIMHARPFGTFEGREAIQGFWQKIMDDGLAEVEYINHNIEIIDSKSAVLTAGWRMNVAQGVIHKELWALQPDGTAKLREDDFEAFQ